MDAICKVLDNQLQMLLKISALAAEYLKTNRATQTPMLITEATAIDRDACK